MQKKNVLLINEKKEIEDLNCIKDRYFLLYINLYIKLIYNLYITYI